MKKTYETMTKSKNGYRKAYTVATNPIDAIKQFNKYYTRIGAVKVSK